MALKVNPLLAMASGAARTFTKQQEQKKLLEFETKKSLELPVKLAKMQRSRELELQSNQIDAMFDRLDEELTKKRSIAEQEHLDRLAKLTNEKEIAKEKQRFEVYLKNLDAQIEGNKQFRKQEHELLMQGRKQTFEQQGYDIRTEELEETERHNKVTEANARNSMAIKNRELSIDEARAKTQEAYQQARLNLDRDRLNQEKNLALFKSAVNLVGIQVSQENAFALKQYEAALDSINGTDWTDPEKTAISMFSNALVNTTDNRLDQKDREAYAGIVKENAKLVANMFTKRGVDMKLPNVNITPGGVAWYDPRRILPGISRKVPPELTGQVSGETMPTAQPRSIPSYEQFMPGGEGLQRTIDDIVKGLPPEQRKILKAFAKKKDGVKDALTFALDNNVEYPMSPALKKSFMKEFGLTQDEVDEVENGLK